MTEQALKEIGKEFVKDIRDAFDEKNLIDRGGAKGSISFRTKPNKLLIEGKGRVGFLNFGRGPNRNFDPDDWEILMPFIRPWVSRVIRPPEEAIYPIAVVISKKIAKHGTAILTDRSKGLELEIIMAELTDELSKKIINFEALEITDGLIKTWETKK